MSQAGRGLSGVQLGPRLGRGPPGRVLHGVAPPEEDASGSKLVVGRSRAD